MNLKDEIIVNKSALILSGVFPGIGQIYKQEYMKGLDLIIIQSLFILSLFYPTGMFLPPGVVLVPILWVLGMADAGIEIPHRRRRNKYSLHIRIVLLVSVVCVLSAIVFALAATVVKLQFNSSEDRVITVNEEPELNLLTKSESITSSADTLSDSNSENSPLNIPVEEFQDLPPEEPNVVIVEAFGKYRDAERLRIRLSQEKYQPLIVPAISNNNQKVYLVAVSGPSDAQNAKAIANKVKQEINEFRD